MNFKHFIKEIYIGRNLFLENNSSAKERKQKCNIILLFKYFAQFLSLTLIFIIIFKAYITFVNIEILNVRIYTTV